MAEIPGKIIAVSDRQKSIKMQRPLQFFAYGTTWVKTSQCAHVGHFLICDRCKTADITLCFPFCF